MCKTQPFQKGTGLQSWSAASSGTRHLAPKQAQLQGGPDGGGEATDGDDAPAARGISMVAVGMPSPTADEAKPSEVSEVSVDEQV